MSTTHERILLSSQKYTELLTTIQETSYARSALHQSQTFLSSLHQQIQLLSSQINKLQDVKDRELKDHEKYQRSTMRRLVIKLSGKKYEFEAKVGREEREYFEAVQELYRAESNLESVKSSAMEVEGKVAGLKQEVARYEEAQRELEVLYNEIFGGPTPEFPEEDAKELPMSALLKTYNTLQPTLHIETQIHTLLQTAKIHLRHSLQGLTSICQASSLDIYDFNNPYTDFAENSSLNQAQISASQALLVLQQARDISPLVQDIGYMEITDARFVSSIVFDKVFSDSAFQGRIWGCRKQVETAWKKLEDEIRVSGGRLEEAKREVGVVKGRLDAARRELWGVRRGVFERVVRGMEVLPGYEE